MLILWSRLAAMAIVLLPIGGLTYHAQANPPAEAAAPCGGWFGFAAEPGMMGLLMMASLWLLVRCAARSE